MSSQDKMYFFNSSERGLFVEIYFPKRAAYYGTIFDALKDGYNEEVVKGYLRNNIVPLITEFQVFPNLFNPHRYTVERLSRRLPTTEEALERINMYKSPFNGWSTYSVDGVFFDDKGDPIEEATQIVRVMFRFQSSFVKHAADDGCSDVLRAMLFWLVSQHGRLFSHKVWGKEEQTQFMARHRPWPKKQETFAKKYFTDVAIEVGKWIDDREIFVFAYLVRKFWENVVKKGMREDEIWVASLFDLVINMVKPTPDLTGFEPPA